MSATDEVRTWKVGARLTYSATVTVQAVDEAAALSKFLTGQWADDGAAGAEMLDVEPVGKPRLVP